MTAPMAAATAISAISACESPKKAVSIHDPVKQFPFWLLSITMPTSSHQGFTRRIPSSKQTSQTPCTYPIRMDKLDTKVHLWCRPCRSLDLQNFYHRYSNLGTIDTQTFCCMLYTAAQAQDPQHHKALAGSPLCPLVHLPTQPAQIQEVNVRRLINNFALHIFNIRRLMTNFALHILRATLYQSANAWDYVA
jgi:hypothetical protein